jgi:Na+-translocating ferredoxin:NAD+ oxidoreductase RnfC subunit
VVSNVESLYNIYNALQGIPVTHTYVSAGGAVSEPGLYRVPVGASATALLEAAGGTSLTEPFYIDGGPMMGMYRKDPNFPLTKLSKALLVLPETSALVKYETMPVANMLKQARVACCQCNQCTIACSRNLVGYDLEPHKIMRAMAYGHQQNMDILKMAMLCSECNLCSGLHACPMQLSPRRVNQEIKRTFREQGVRPEFPEKEMEVHPLRNYRLLPSSRIKQRLNLAAYDTHPPFKGDLEVTRVKIPMQQHIGVPSIPIVERGEKVRLGQLIGTIPEETLGARIHASIDGYVSSVDPEYVVITKDKE